MHERRAGTVAILSRKISALSAPDEVFKKVNTILKKNPADIPFCFIYTVSRKIPASGAGGFHQPGMHRLKNLPFADLIKNGAIGAYTGSVLFYGSGSTSSIGRNSQMKDSLFRSKPIMGKSSGFLFAGLSARRQYDRDYHHFVESLASTISASLNTFQSLAEERNRAEAINAARLRLAESEAALTHRQRTTGNYI